MDQSAPNTTGHEAPGTTIVTPDEPQHGGIDGPRSKPADLCSGVLTREETFVHGKPGGIERLPFVGKVCCRSSWLATGRSLAHVWSKRSAMWSAARDTPLVDRARTGLALPAHHQQTDPHRHRHRTEKKKQHGCLQCAGFTCSTVGFGSATPETQVPRRRLSGRSSTCLRAGRC